jgi:hypothetical protein
VVAPGRLPRSGRSGLGCIISLVVFLAALYYGVTIGQIYFRYYEILSSMRSQARLASTLTDEVIDRRLRQNADSLLPKQNPEFRITRRTQPNRIVIETQYTEHVSLPFYKHTFILRPHAEEPL